jgi:hypothetical protein
MNPGTNNSLRRIDDIPLPPTFHLLSDADKVDFIKKLAETDLELRRRLEEKKLNSLTAEHDLRVAIDTINHLQDERKMFTHKSKGETGSGTYELTVRGADTNLVRTLAIAAIGAILAIAVLSSAK